LIWKHGIHLRTPNPALSGRGQSSPTQKTHFVEVAENLFCLLCVLASAHGRNSGANLILGARAADLYGRICLADSRAAFSPRFMRGLEFRLNAKGDLKDCLRSFLCQNSPLRADFAAGQAARRFILVAQPTNCDVGFTWAPGREAPGHGFLPGQLVKGAAGQAVQNMNLMFRMERRGGG